MHLKDLHNPFKSDEWVYIIPPRQLRGLYRPFKGPLNACYKDYVDPFKAYIVRLKGI